MTRHVRDRWPSLAPFLCLIASMSLSPSEASQPAFETKGMVEKVVSELPPEPLFWRIEILPAQAREKAVPGPTSLAATISGSGEVWLFTLGRMGASTPGATKIVEIGPVSPPTAAGYALRVYHVHGHAGARTRAHNVPGSEAFYVRTGRVGVKTPRRVKYASAGQGIVCFGGEQGAEVFSAGNADLDQFVMLVGDAEKPFRPRFE